MEIKLSGAKFKQFLDDPNIWGSDGGYWLEDEEVWVNGSPLDEDVSYSDVGSTDKITIKEGFIVDYTSSHKDLVLTLKNWLREQASTSFIVTVPNERVEEFKNLLTKHGFVLK